MVQGAAHEASAGAHAEKHHQCSEQPRCFLFFHVNSADLDYINQVNRTRMERKESAGL